MYRHPHVQNVQDLYGSLIQLGEAPSFLQWAQAMANRLKEGFEHQHPGAGVEIRNYEPSLGGAPSSQLFSTSFSSEDLFDLFARSLHFTSWAHLLEVPEWGTVPFQEAVDALVGGEIRQLEALLRAHPGLVGAHSPFGHQAGLVHYLAVNGVETWRQQVPSNFLAIAELLLRYGADPQQGHQIYGGTATLQGLMETSSHLKAAGILEQLLDIMEDY